jgi:hypothetical protein
MQSGIWSKNGARTKKRKTVPKFSIKKWFAKIMQSKYFDLLVISKPITLCCFTVVKVFQNFIKKCQKNRVFKTYLEIRFFEPKNMKSTKIVSKILKI